MGGDQLILNPVTASINSPLHIREKKKEVRGGRESRGQKKTDTLTGGYYG